ncbi:MAG: DUF58 domain-containing protein [Lachnospiraceae bacterium]|nr:DUF58 domain-containing protein [Lachnospiraceae bacterium]
MAEDKNNQLHSVKKEDGSESLGNDERNAKPDAQIFDSLFFQKVSRLRVAIARKSTLSYQGRRKTSYKGNSAEFSDFREYLPGDDLRRIDWNVYARLDKPYIREYMEEREGAVNLFLDLSASMGFWGKDVLSKQLAGAVAVAALSNLDRISLSLIEEDRLSQLRLSGGKNNCKRALKILEDAKMSGNGDLAQAIRHVPYLPAGISILVSDFMQESFLEKGEELCRYLKYRGQKVILMQILAKEEQVIEEFGTYELLDAEGAYESVRISLDEKTVSGYEKELAAFLKQVQRIAENSGADHYLCSTKDGFERILTQTLRMLWA